MAGKNGKRFFRALSAIAASVAAGTMIKNKISEKKNKKEKGLYYTVSLKIYTISYDDKTLSEEEMINEIKKKVHFKK